MRFRSNNNYAACLIAALAACNATRLHGQQVLVNFNVPGPADWDVPGNWDPANRPEAGFDEVAVIGGGRSAFVASAVPNTGGIIMDLSTLEIRSGGSLVVEPGPSTPNNGNITLGQSLNTNLIVRRGGSLTARNISSGGGPATELLLGETGGSGTATLSVTGGTLNRNTRIVGPNVAFSSSGSLAFGGQHRLAPVITGATHSTINVTGSATLAGTVRPEFSGYTPVLGNSWDLVTAGSLTSTMTLDTSGLPILPRGTAFNLSATGTTAKLGYNNFLILSVNRGTGVARIENAVGSAIGFDGYTITSPSGALGGTWNSLQDQAIAGWDEADNSTANRRTEFKTSGLTSLAAGNSVSL
ncbi:MAG: hypothetical protein H0T51_12050, partial [Pirellulales bacterium]|nr:hypothetical protein [Pirellulales bacterium]